MEYYECEHKWNTEFEADNSICILCGFINNEIYRRHCGQAT